MLPQAVSLEARLFALRLLEALREDLPFVDITSRIVPQREVSAYVLAKAEGVLAGMEEVVELLRLLGFEVVKAMRDGDVLKPGDKPLVFKGPAPEVLKVERTLLNLLTHASGVATVTRAILLKAKAANPQVKVAATRKTLPFLRYIEKKAVLISGGDPHRYSLSDAVLIKDNHLRLLGGVAEAVKRAKEAAPFTARVEVEVNDVKSALEAAAAGADIIMLDNMPPWQVAEVDKKLREAGLRERVILEASGGIGEDNVALYAPYVDVISVGALTHSARALDMSLELEPFAP